MLHQPSSNECINTFELAVESLQEEKISLQQNIKILKNTIKTQKTEYEKQLGSLSNSYSNLSLQNRIMNSPKKKILENVSFMAFTRVNNNASNALRNK